MEEIEGCCELLSLIIISLYLMITYTLRNIVHCSDCIGFAKLPILEMIASAELTACACEVSSDLAFEGSIKALFFVAVWVALFIWFDSQWLVETCNPGVCVENVLENRLTERVASLFIWAELGGAVIGYRTYSLLRSNFKDGPEYTSPLKENADTPSTDVQGESSSYGYGTQDLERPEVQSSIHPDVPALPGTSTGRQNHQTPPMRPSASDTNLLKKEGRCAAWYAGRVAWRSRVSTCCYFVPKRFGPQRSPELWLRYRSRNSRKQVHRRILQPAAHHWGISV